MNTLLSPRATLLALASGVTLALGVSLPSTAQLNVTGGGATINDATIFVPTDGTITGTPAGIDTRGVITQGTFRDVTIQTNHGNLPTNAIFRPSTLPTINNFTGTPTDINAGATGTVLGTVSFQGVSALGAQFFNVPTTLNFSVVNAVPIANQGALTEYRATGFILQETGFVGAANGGAYIRRRTPVTLVQYGTGGAADTTVLGTPVPAAAYTGERAGASFTAPSIDLSFESGQVFAPPGLTFPGSNFIPGEGPGNNGRGLALGRLVRQFRPGFSQVAGISRFNRVAIILLPSFDDIVFNTGGTPGTGTATPPAGDDTTAGGDDENPLVGALPGTDDDDTVAEGDDDGDDVVADGDDDGDDVVADGDDDGDDVVADGDDDDDDVVADGDDDDDDDDDDAVAVNPNTGITQFRPVLPRFVFIGIFVFNNVPTGRWVDPPVADGFEYEMTPRDIPVGVASRVFPGMTGVAQADDAVFTRISGFPIGVDVDDSFVVAVEGRILGRFGPGDTLRFSDYASQLGDLLVNGGVRKFTISDINPAVSSVDPIAFPLQLDFNTETASFEMRALEADPTGELTRIAQTTR